MTQVNTKINETLSKRWAKINLKHVRLSGSFGHYQCQSSNNALVSLGLPKNWIKAAKMFHQGHPVIEDIVLPFINPLTESQAELSAMLLKTL